ncbi:Prevent-host-death family protein [Thiocapsa sp. KS1]|nr:type II toxin-antitoxin system Phd/YefM family antitoxin [Thiocapsa sp. KS1]CRI68025.1 Prevent-host-death family protein [Thiocapsa sp. KS1]
MQAINMPQAKTNLSRLVEAIEQGTEREIVIARNGHPVAKLAPVSNVPIERRIGVAKGLFVVPDDIDAHNQDVARLFLGERPGKDALDEQG